MCPHIETRTETILRSRSPRRRNGDILQHRLATRLGYEILNWKFVWELKVLFEEANSLNWFIWLLCYWSLAQQLRQSRAELICSSKLSCSTFFATHDLITTAEAALDDLMSLVHLQKINDIGAVFVDFASANRSVVQRATVVCKIDKK